MTKLNITEPPTVSNEINIEIDNYWCNLNVYRIGKEFMFSLKTKDNDTYIKSYKSFKVGVKNIESFINKF